MTARPTLTILADIQELDAKRIALVAELRASVANDEIDKAIATDPVLRAIFEPAENLVARLKNAERVERGDTVYFLPKVPDNGA